MVVKALLVALLVGGGLFGLVAAAWPSYAPPVVEAAIEPEKPWFSWDALREVLGGERGLGPLFEGSVVGGSAPSPATRARIAAFAKAHDVGLDLEIRDDELRSVTLDITFGGCCGYEGVDVMAMGLGRPRWSECCGCRGAYIDNWALHTEDARIRVTIRVNRLTLHWEPLMRLPEALAKLDAMVGLRADAVARSEGEHWKEIEAGLYLLELPFQFTNAWEGSSQPGLKNRSDLGAEVRVEGGEIVEVTFSLPSIDGDEEMAAYRAQWGTPKITDDVRTWTKRDRVITSERGQRRVLIKKR